MTDETASRLLRPLRGEPDGPPGFDVARAMAEGRRRRGLRRWTTGAALIAVTTVTAGGGTFAVAAMRPEPTDPNPAPVTSVTPSVQAAAPTAAPPPESCEVALLPTGGVRKALVTSGDPSGRYHAGRLYGAAENLIIWKDGKIGTRFRVPGADASIYDLNRSGAGVGSSHPGEKEQAYIYREGRATALDGAETRAFAINEAGVVVGAIGGFPNEVPARWRSEGAKIERLPLPDGATHGAASEITEDGLVIGTVGPSRIEASGYLWQADGTGKAMPLPTVDGRKADYFWPTSAADGWILGRAVFEGPPSAPDDTRKNAGERTFAVLKYRISDGSYQRLPESFIGTYSQLAGNGWVLGTVHPDRAAIVSGSAVVELPAYRKFKEYVTTSFSDDGRIAAGYTTDMGTEEVDNRPILWTCQ